jgi:hypothetical protein
VLADVLVGLAPALDELNGLVSLLANVQEPGGSAGAYREVAVRVTLGGAAELAQLDLAKAEVGPNLPGMQEQAVGAGQAGGPGTPGAAGGATILPNVGAGDLWPMTFGGLFLLFAGLTLTRRGRPAA